MSRRPLCEKNEAKAVDFFSPSRSHLQRAIAQAPITHENRIYSLPDRLAAPRGSAGCSSGERPRARPSGRRARPCTGSRPAGQCPRPGTCPAGCRPGAGTRSAGCGPRARARSADRQARAPQARCGWPEGPEGQARHERPEGTQGQTSHEGTEGPQGYALPLLRPEGAQRQARYEGPERPEGYARHDGSEGPQRPAGSRRGRSPHRLRLHDAPAP